MNANHSFGRFARVLALTTFIGLLAGGGCRPSDEHDYSGHGHDEAHSEHGENEHADHTEIPADMAARSGIRVETAGPGRIRSLLELAGEIRLNAEATTIVPARFEGVVLSVNHRVGDEVKRGEVLAVIESRELADARAEFIEAVHRLELAQARYVREEALWRKKIGVEQDYLRARHELEETEIRRQTARQKLHALGISESELNELAAEPQGKVVTFKVRQPFPQRALSRYELKAPIAGRVIERRVAVGQNVRPADTLFHLADLSQVWADFAVYSGQLPQVRRGARIIVSDGERELEGEISYLSSFVSEPARAAIARVVLPNPDGRWRPGMFVSGRVVVGETNAPVTVAIEALQSLEGRTVVFVNEGERYEATPVRVGLRDPQRVEILSGLKAGQRYVAAGSFVVKADILKSTAAHDHD